MKRRLPHVVDGSATMANEAGKIHGEKVRQKSDGKKCLNIFESTDNTDNVNYLKIFDVMLRTAIARRESVLSQ